MITNTGKDIIAKYLLGQAPAFASHIAIGAGKKPLLSTDSLEPYQAEFAYKENLDFEMFRVPIISRGYVSDSDPNIVTITRGIRKWDSCNIYSKQQFCPRRSC